MLVDRDCEKSVHNNGDKLGDKFLNTLLLMPLWSAAEELLSLISIGGNSCLSNNYFRHLHIDEIDKEG